MREISQSCLVSRLSRFIGLTGEESEFIAAMEKNEQKRLKGRPVVGLGDRTDGHVPGRGVEAPAYGKVRA
jgi:hypothetical protein